MFGHRKTYRVLFADWSTGFDAVDQLHHRPLGGRLTFLRHLPVHLQRAGHVCHVLSDAAGGEIDGVKWYGKDDYDSVCRERYDFLVTMRGTLGGLPEISARRRILCIRDLPHFGLCGDPRVMRAFCAAIVGSRYGADVWRTYYRDLPKTYIIPNGVDREIFFPRAKQDGYIIFASAPNRGLMRLPLIADMVRAKTGRGITVKAFGKLGQLHPGEVKKDVYVDGHAIDYAMLNTGSIEWHDPLPQKELADEIGRASLMLIPSGFPEICSNSVLQALSSGTPVITTGGVGANPEYIRHGVDGFLTRYAPHDYMVYDIEIARLVVRALESAAETRRMASNALRAPKLMDWSEVSETWVRIMGALY